MRLVLGLKAKTTDTRGRAGGEVEAIGRDVTQFKAGDQVLAFRGMRFGTYAQYICMREDALLLLKPDHVTYDDAAAVSFGGTTACIFLEKEYPAGTQGSDLRSVRCGWDVSRTAC